MAITWKNYAKDKFTVIGTASISNNIDFPGLGIGKRYVWAICTTKVGADIDVAVGGIYLLKWDDNAATMKVEAPDPPFHNGDGISKEDIEKMIIDYFENR